jgi:predicted unusual protein kinase regulating ubiquinone biosynthesis (AarF/ABC1/UbiB family)
MCRSKFGKYVHIPDIYKDLSSSRILTMEFVAGATPKDREGLQKLGFSPQKVTTAIYALQFSVRFCLRTF